MYYNFNGEDLKTEAKIEEYKAFAQEVLENMQAVREAYKKLKEIKSSASLASKIGVLNYKSAKETKKSGMSDYRIYATGEVYSSDRLRQVIYASQRGENIAISARYQEGTGLEDDPFIDVAEICFEYNPNTQELQLGEVLDTKQLVEMRENIKDGISGAKREVSTNLEQEEEK